MEPLWSPVVATGGNQRQLDGAPKPQKKAKTVAVDCHRLPAMVRRGSPVRVRKRALTKAPQTRGFRFPDSLHFIQHARVWNRFWNSQTKEAATLLPGQASHQPTATIRRRRTRQRATATSMTISQIERASSALCRSAFRSGSARRCQGRKKGRSRGSGRLASTASPRRPPEPGSSARRPSVVP